MPGLVAGAAGAAGAAGVWAKAPIAKVDSTKAVSRVSFRVLMKALHFCRNPLMKPLPRKACPPWTAKVV